VPASFVSQGKAEVFEERSSRYYGLLCFTVCLVLGSRVSPIVRVDCRPRQAGPEEPVSDGELPCILMMQTDVIPRNYCKKRIAEPPRQEPCRRDINRVSLVLDVSGTKT
jgi:hypothetical protein